MAASNAALGRVEVALGRVHVGLGDRPRILGKKRGVASVVDSRHLVLRPCLGGLRARLSHLRLRLLNARTRLDHGGLRLEHLRLGLIETGLAALERHLVVAGVELDQQSTLFDVLVVIHPDLGHQPRNARADLMHVPGSVSVVGALVDFFVVIKRDGGDHENRQHNQGNDDPQERSEEPFYLARLFVFFVAVFALAVTLTFLLLAVFFLAVLPLFLFFIAAFFFPSPSEPPFFSACSLRFSSALAMRSSVWRKSSFCSGETGSELGGLSGIIRMKW